MRALADLHIALVRCVGELVEVGVQHVAGQILIPLGMREESRHANTSGVVQGLARSPKFTRVLNGAIRCPQHLRRLFRAYRIGGKRRICPCLKPARRNQLSFFIFRHPGQPAAFGSLFRNGAIRPQLAAGICQGRRIAHPLRRIQHQLVDLVIILRGVPGHGGSAPGPAEQIQFGDTAPFENEIYRRAHVFHRGFGAHDRLVLVCRCAHFQGPCRFTIAA